MEKAILRTLIYADIFDYPLTIREIHKWLIGKKAEPRKVEKELRIKNLEFRIKKHGEFYFLKGREELVRKRKERKKHSYIYIRKVRWISWLLRMIPWIRLVGISGGLAVENAGRYDDIDLFIITNKNRLWISRLMVLGLLTMVGQRRKRTDCRRRAAGKICCNTILEEDQLIQTNKDLYTAHEVLQMKVLWQKDGMYQKFLEENSWAFRYLPNWIGNSEQVVSSKYQVLRDKKPTKKTLNTIFNVFEGLAKSLQLNYMGKPKGMERISDGALYFYPEDCRARINSEYQKKLRRAGLI